MTTLNQLEQGKKAVIASVPESCRLFNRLRDLGIIEGSVISCVNRKKGIAAYFVRGTVIALRDCDTQCVEIKLKPEGNSHAKQRRS